MLGVMFILGSVVSCCADVAMEKEPGAGIGFAIGIILYIAGRFGAWWKHG